MVAANRLSVGTSFPLGSSGSLAFVNFTINSAGASIDRVAWIFQAENIEAITQLMFRYGVRTGTPVQHKISLQSPDASGLPDGVILGGGTPASGLFTPPADATWDGTVRSITLDNSFTPTRGQWLAEVIEPVGTPDATNNSSFTHSFNSWFAELRAGTPYFTTQTDGAAWSRGQDAPIFGYKTATQAYGRPVQDLLTSTIGVAGDRQALKLVLPAGFGDTFKILKTRMFLEGIAAAGQYIIGIWDAAGTVQQAITVDSDLTGRVNLPNTFYETVTDDLPATLNFGTTYYVGIERVGTLAVGLTRFGFAAAADQAAIDGGSAHLLATWNGTVWTDQTLERPFVDLLFDDWTEPAGGTTVVAAVENTVITKHYQAVGY